MTEENTQEAQQEGTPVVQLSLADIAAVVQIIDITTKRGAYEGPELEAVGAVRNRFEAFVQAHAAETEGTEPSAVAEDGSEVEVEEVEEA